MQATHMHTCCLNIPTTGVITQTKRAKTGLPEYVSLT